MKMLGIILLALLLCGCGRQTPPPSTVPPETLLPTEIQPAPTEETAAPDPLEALLDSMTLEEKVGQLFLARCPETDALQAVEDYHLGGFVLFGRDFENQTPDSIRETLRGYQAQSKLPMLLAVDEEGGTVCRVSRWEAFRPERFPAPRTLYAQGGLPLVLSIESEKALLLSSLGINVNLAPVCDISQNPESFLYPRSLGEGPEETGAFVAESLRRMAEYGVGGVMKHFPGYGENADTHLGAVGDDRSLDRLESWDLMPFAAGIETGLGAVMVSHNTVAALDGEHPASLSPKVMGYLREEMGFSGVILTDDLSMGALEGYTSAEAAVLAVKAGASMLCSTDYETQYNAILEAVQAGEIPGPVVDDAVYRVLTWKHQLGLV